MPLLRSLFVTFALLSFTTITACAGEIDIVHGLNELEANRILVVLGSQGIDATKIKEEARVITWAIIVSQSDAQRSLQILVENNLPQTRSTGLAEVYPAGGGGLIPTKSEEKAKFMMAIQGEIERKLKTLPNVQQAHVSVVNPDKDVIRDLDTPPPPSTASVALVYNPGPKGGPPASIEEIKNLVSASVEDLRGENVEVLLKANVAGMMLVGTDDEDGPAVAMGEKVLGIQVANKGAGKKAMAMFGIFGALALIGIIIGGVGIGRAVSLKKKLSKAIAEAASMKKARRDV